VGGMGGIWSSPLTVASSHPFLVVVKAGWASAGEFFAVAPDGSRQLMLDRNAVCSAQLPTFERWQCRCRFGSWSAKNNRETRIEPKR
jgi:hypothetical protein